MRKITQFQRMTVNDLYYGGLEWGTPIGSVQAVDKNGQWHLYIDDILVLKSADDKTVVNYVNKRIKEARMK